MLVEPTWNWVAFLEEAAKIQDNPLNIREINIHNQKVDECIRRIRSLIEAAET